MRLARVAPLTAASLLAVAAPAWSASAVIMVDGDGRADVGSCVGAGAAQTTIQAGVTAAADGDASLTTFLLSYL